MAILIKGVEDYEYIYKIIPKVIQMYALEKYDAKKAIKLNKYLKKFNTSVHDLLLELEDNIEITKINDFYTIKINELVIDKQSNMNYNSLIKLIDYGNIEIEGLHIVENAMNFVRNNIRNIYMMSRLKKGDT